MRDLKQLLYAAKVSTRNTRKKGSSAFCLIVAAKSECNTEKDGERIFQLRKNPVNGEVFSLQKNMKSELKK